MSEDSMRQWVEDTLITQMGANYPNWGVKIPNVKFERDGNYVDYNILEGDSQQTTLGPVASTRHVGVLQLNVMVVQNTGQGEMNAVVASLGSWFGRAGVTLVDCARLVTRTPSPRWMGTSDGYAWKAISIPFYRDEEFTNAQTIVVP